MRIDPCPLIVRSYHTAEMMPQVGKVLPYHHESYLIYLSICLQLICSNKNNENKRNKVINKSINLNPWFISHYLLNVIYCHIQDHLED